MNIIAIKIDSEIEQGLYMNLLKGIPKEKQVKLNKFRKRIDAQRSLLGEILVRTEIMKLLNIKNNDIQVQKNSYGKPILLNEPQFHFNVSHSGDWVVCAIDYSIIGIDVEKITSIDFAIAERFFTKQETLDLFNIEGSEQTNYFYDLWTLKESYIKADGRGLSLPLDSFTIYKTNSDIKIVTENELKDVYFKQYEIDKLYKCSVCTITNQFPIEPRIQSMLDTCQTFLDYIY